MKLTKAERWAIALTAVFVAVTVGYHAGRLQSETPFYVTTELSLPTEAPQPDRSLPLAEEPREQAAEGPVNLNTADAETLRSLSGVGEKLAERIIDYRKEHGPFTAIEEIKLVSGIGEKIFEANRDRLTVGEDGA